MKRPSIARGRIIIYRIFDVAVEINLSLIERKAGEGARRLKFSKYPYMKALEITNPPIAFDLQPFAKLLFDREINVTVVAKAYDFGVISIAFDIPVPESTSFEELEAVTRGLDIDESIDTKAAEYVSQLMETLKGSVVGPEVKSAFLEDYTIFYVERLGDGFEGIQSEEFVKRYDPSRLLLYEARELSDFTRRDTLRHSFSYYPDDLVIIHVDNAFILDPTGSLDMPDILEFANAQFLELRYYDHVIDGELESIYAELTGKSRVALFRLREYGRLVRKMTRTVSEITELTEKVNNSLKVTEDIYYSRIYRTFMSLLRSRDWEVSIAEKLQVIINTYKMTHDEIALQRGHLLELGIIILIVLEIILFIVK
ncbi:MAG: hypothetical protein HY889_08130 [Deltaproteobacteria bacterium]|nr:hypothetical protein [Deltaproteobacteria bacterium]